MGVYRDNGNGPVGKDSAEYLIPETLNDRKNY